MCAEQSPRIWGDSHRRRQAVPGCRAIPRMWGGCWIRSSFHGHCRAIPRYVGRLTRVYPKALGATSNPHVRGGWYGDRCRCRWIASNPHIREEVGRCCWKHVLRTEQSHTRGEAIGAVGAAGWAFEQSPLTWGGYVADGLHQVRCPSDPHVRGEVRRSEQALHHSSSNPHVRGEVSVRPRPPAPVPEQSPRTWGGLLFFIAAVAWFRAIPTYVGRFERASHCFRV